MAKEEIWKSVPDYIGYYQVSNLGRVRSLDRIVNHGSGTFQYKKGVVLTQSKSSSGYYSVTLIKGGHRKIFMVHRLVAGAFLENKLNLPIVNHRDENKLNNRLENLEWCSYAYNTTYNNCMRRRVNTRNKNQSHGMEKRVYQYGLNGNLVNVWESLMDASRALNIPQGNIANCCLGTKYRHTAYGYKWSYELK